MELDLVDGRSYLGRLQDGIEMRLQEVADPDALCLATGRHLFHLGPFLLQYCWVLICKERSVDEV